MFFCFLFLCVCVGTLISYCCLVSTHAHDMAGRSGGGGSGGAGCRGHGRLCLCGACQLLVGYVVSWVPYWFDVTVEHVCVCCSSKPHNNLVPEGMVNAPMVSQACAAETRTHMGWARGSRWVHQVVRHVTWSFVVHFPCEMVMLVLFLADYVLISFSIFSLVF